MELFLECVIINILEVKVKTKQITALLDDITKQVFGHTRTNSIGTDTCVRCGCIANEFKDQRSAREYKISGFCQKCQDEIFGD